MLRLFLIQLVVLSGGYVGLVAENSLPPAATGTVDFHRDIQPIFAQRCCNCHGEQKQKSGLRLDRKSGFVQGGDSGEPVFVAGKSAESRLIQLVTGQNPDMIMPPSGKPLTSEQIGLLRAWIDQGANWPETAETPARKHWAYVPPVCPELPAVKEANWPRNPIDYFILARLDKEGLQPAPEADRARLIRRVSLDLIGLPPTLAEVEAFLADSSPDAYEKMVDRLLASPDYGVRWARPWLDLARYADTQGYEKDARRSMWPYRDWVVQAFNRNLPFDQFTIEQIAGDLLPEATTEQKVATGFHRNTMTNAEGGTDDEEFRHEAVIDRVNTTMSVWMGTTLGCAQCHNHKYDPITMKEYYRVYAFFNNTADADRDDEAPTLKLFGPGQEEELTKLQAVVKERQQEFEAETEKPYLAVAQAVWEDQMRRAFDYWNLIINPIDYLSLSSSIFSLETPTDGDQPPLPDNLKQQVEASFALPNEIRTILIRASDQWNEKQKTRLKEYYHSISPELKTHREALAAARKAEKEFQDTIPSSAVMVELDRPRKTHLLIRGSFLTKGDPVEPGVPAVLHPLPDPEPLHRLTLARWLVATNNPLTARVTMNRIWEQYFGHAIVNTVGDFGKQGDPPTHPELLDWLATEFMRVGWDLKAMHKVIVTSATYCQSSQLTPALLERDPDNRLLARGPRLRLEAEMIRDQALAVAGLLSHKLGGPSVMPPQPEGLWQVVYSNDQWITSKAEDKYRRGLYTFWRRTNPYPLMTAFDGPSREYCVLRRVRSNTPLQALNLLNDPAFIEAAQALARRLIAQSGDTEARIQYAFRVCLGREPSVPETNRLKQLFETSLTFYRTDAGAAEKMATSECGPPRQCEPVEELAAWTVVANVLLNLDEMITKG